MAHWGSFSPDSYEAFLGKIENPTNFMVVAPALASRAATAPSSYFMDEGDNEEDMEMSYDGESEEDKDDEFESNASMAMTQLRSMAQDIMDILSVLTPNENLEPWVAAKITMSKQNLSAVADYLNFSDV